VHAERLMAPGPRLTATAEVAGLQASEYRLGSGSQRRGDSKR
jgi:hypothetical protein